MRAKEFRQQRKRIRRVFDAWIQPLGLRWWNIAFVYHRKRKGFATTAYRQTFARVTADWRYMEAQIDVNVSAVQNTTDAELERACVHELAHVLLNELQDRAVGCTDHEERVAQTLARAFVWVRDGDWGSHAERQ